MYSLLKEVKSTRKYSITQNTEYRTQNTEHRTHVYLILGIITGCMQILMYPIQERTKAEINKKQILAVCQLPATVIMKCSLI
jgi:hypothetical protein